MTPSSSQLPLFTFGTLMDTEVLQCVSGILPSTLAIIPARVVDRVQHEVLGEGFPILLPAPGQEVLGRLIFGLTETAMQRILFFEGDEYATQPLTVETDGASQEALYFKDSGVYETTGKSWIFSQWHESEHATFLERTQQYMRLFGTMSTTEADRYW